MPLPDVPQSDYDAYTAELFSERANKRISTLDERASFLRNSSRRINSLGIELPEAVEVSSPNASVLRSQIAPPIIPPVRLPQQPQPTPQPQAPTPTPAPPQFPTPQPIPAPTPEPFGPVTLTPKPPPPAPTPAPPAPSPSPPSVVPYAPEVPTVPGGAASSPTAPVGILPGQGAAPTRVGQGQSDFVTSLQPLAQNVASRSGIDPNVMIAIAANETGWGRSQTAREQNNLFSIQGPSGQASRWATYTSPEQSFEAFVDLISTAPRYRQAWAVRNDPERFVEELRKAGYVVDEPGFPAQGWVDQVKSINRNLPAQQAAVVAAAPASAPARPAATALAQSQFGDRELTASEAYAACGPAAAVRFAQAYGRNPTLREATDLAAEVGWTQEQGMAGIASEQRLMHKLGLDTRLVMGRNWDQYAREAQTGNPVVISTPGHYFYADGFNPVTGAFHVGRSGLDLRRGKEWMTPDEMEGLMGSAQGALFSNMPTVTAPSSTIAGTPSELADVRRQISSGFAAPGVRTQGQPPPAAQPNDPQVQAIDRAITEVYSLPRADVVKPPEQQRPPERRVPEVIMPTPQPVGGGGPLDVFGQAVSRALGNALSSLGIGPPGGPPGQTDEQRRRMNTLVGQAAEATTGAVGQLAATPAAQALPSAARWLLDRAGDFVSGANQEYLRQEIGRFSGDEEHPYIWDSVRRIADAERQGDFGTAAALALQAAGNLQPGAPQQGAAGPAVTAGLERAGVPGLTGENQVRFPENVPLVGGKPIPIREAGGAAAMLASGLPSDLGVEAGASSIARQALRAAGRTPQEAEAIVSGIARAGAGAGREGVAGAGGVERAAAAATEAAAEAEEPSGEVVKAISGPIRQAMDAAAAQPSTTAELADAAATINSAPRSREGLVAGAPEQAQTAEGLAGLRRQLLALANEGEAQRDWYTESSKAIKALTGDDPVEGEKLAQLLAIYSPNNSVTNNTEMALKAWYQYKAGEPIRAGMGRFDKKANALLYDNKPWAGRKTNNFYRNLMKEIDPNVHTSLGTETGQTGVTVDIWMMRALGYLRDNPTPAQYDFVQNEIERIARMKGWTPDQAQAAIWSSIKAGSEGTNVERAGFNYATALADRYGQVSWTASPGSTEAQQIPGYLDAPETERQVYNAASAAALRDPNTGRDLLAEAMGVVRGPTIDVPEVYQGYVGPGLQTHISLPSAPQSFTEKVPLLDAEGNPILGRRGQPKTEDVSVDIPKNFGLIHPEARNAINAYAAATGILYKQDAVPWTRVFLGESQRDSNVMNLHIGRPLSSAEARQIDDNLTAVLGPNAHAVVATRDGAWILNLQGQFEREDVAPRVIEYQKQVKGVGKVPATREERITGTWIPAQDWDTGQPVFRPNPQFHREVVDAVSQVDFDLPTEAHLTPLRGDGQYVSNDWSKSAQGEDYRSLLESTGRAAAFANVEAPLTERIQRAQAAVASRFGWPDNPNNPFSGRAAEQSAFGDFLSGQAGQAQVGAAARLGLGAGSGLVAAQTTDKDDPNRGLKIAAAALGGLAVPSAARAFAQTTRLGGRPPASVLPAGAIGNRIPPPTVPPGALQLGNTAARRFAYEATNRRVAIDQLEEAYARALGRKLQASEKFASLVRLQPGAAAEEWAKSALGPAIRMVGDHLQSLVDLVTLRHNISVASGLGARHGPAVATARQFSGGLDLAGSQAALRKLEADLGPEKWKTLNRAADMVFDHSRDVRQRLVDADVFSPQQATDFEMAYNDWVKTHILDFAERQLGSGMGGRVGLNSKEVNAYTLAGTQRSRLDPLASAVDYTYRAERMARKNEAYRALADLDDELYNKTGQRELIRVARTKAEYQAARAAGQPILPVGYKAVAGEYPIHGFRGGDPETYITRNPMVAEAINAADTNALPGWARAPASIVRAGATARNPAFLVGNTMLDVPTYMLTTTARGELRGLTDLPWTVYELVRGFGDVMQGIGSGRMTGKGVQEFLRGGGGFSGSSAFRGGPTSASDLVRQMRREGALTVNSRGDALQLLNDVAGFGWTQALGQRLELAPRVAAMRMAQRRGLQGSEAIIQGRRVTMDFDEAGRTAKFINQIVPFFNVGVQGPTIMARLVRDHPVGTAVAGLSMVGVPAFMAEVHNHSTPEMARDYEDVPDYIKDTSLVWMLGSSSTDDKGNKRPNYIAVNMRAWAPFAQAAREVANRAAGREGSSWEELASQLWTAENPTGGSGLANFSAGLIPTPLGTAFSVQQNKDYFRDSAIMTNRTDENASAASQALAEPLTRAVQQLPGQEAARVRPSALDFIARDIGSGLANVPLGASDLAAGRRRSDEPANIPVLGGFAGRVVRGQGGQRGEDARQQSSMMDPEFRQKLRSVGDYYEPTPVQGTIEGMPLRSDEQAEYQIRVNTYFNKNMERALTDRVLRNERSRQKAIEWAMDRARDSARREILRKIPRNSQVLRKRYESSAY